MCIRDSSSALGPVTASIRLMPAAIEPSLMILKKPICPVLATWVPPHSSTESVSYTHLMKQYNSTTLVRTIWSLLLALSALCLIPTVAEAKFELVYELSLIHIYVSRGAT